MRRPGWRGLRSQLAIALATFATLAAGILSGSDILVVAWMFAVAGGSAISIGVEGYREAKDSYRKGSIFELLLAIVSYGIGVAFLPVVGYALLSSVIWHKNSSSTVGRLAVGLVAAWFSLLVCVIAVPLVVRGGGVARRRLAESGLSRHLPGWLCFWQALLFA